MFNSFSLLLDYSQFFSKKRIVRVLLFSKKKKNIYIYIYIYSKHIICRVILSPEIFSLLVFEDFSVGPELLCLPLTRNERGML